MAEATWPFLVVLDLDEFTVRCRTCQWVSAPAGTLQEARGAYVDHVCPGGWYAPPLLGWCACCGRVAVRGLRPANPSIPRAWVRTWICADRQACRRRAGCSSG
jgi:hypothetical protein